MYKKNSDYNFYQKEDAASIQYSDGSETEDKLYDIILSVEDKSVLSEELKKRISDWPTEYHFSRRRHCLLRPLDIKPGDRVLELGCGCGAITRYLGESGAIVDSVEGTFSRARIAGERCKDLPNVKIHVDNFLDFTSSEKYDWVLFIGVLEYAPLFSDSADPIGSYLDLAARYSSEKGQLVVAIENKLGLKYFNGCGEDHLNDFNLSIENRYQKKSPVTFGKKELLKLLNDRDFCVNDFYYPFPDYKLPSFIITEQGFSEPLFDSGELLKACTSRDYTGKTGRVFEESLVWPELVKNDIATELANSFMIVATKISQSYEAHSKSTLLANYFNTDRLKNYITETRFVKKEESIKVKKENLFKNAENKKLILKTLEQDYQGGKTLQSEMEDEWNKYNDIAILKKYYGRWLRILLSVTDESSTVSDDYIDLVPFNIKIGSDESIFIFDQEWQLNGRIDFNWIACRGIYWSLVNLKTIHPLEIKPFDLIHDVFVEHGLNITVDAFDDIKVKERNFIKEITGENIEFFDVVHKQPERIVNLHYHHLDLLSQYRNQLTCQENRLVSVEKELFEINSSRINRLVIRIIRKIRSYRK